MHNIHGGINIVDKLTEFCIPNSKDQLYVLEEVIEKVYMFKVLDFDTASLMHLMHCFYILITSSLKYNRAESWIIT